MLSDRVLTLDNLLAGAVGICVVAILLFVKRLWGRARAIIVTGMGQQPFESRPVMNRGEQALYRRLLEAAPRGTMVLAQVQLSGFLQVRGLIDREERWKYLSKIIRLSVDFLIVDAQSMAPLAGVELDGPSHDARRAFGSGQMDADARKYRAMRSAGVPLLRFPVGHKLAVAELREALDRAIRA